VYLFLLTLLVLDSFLLITIVLLQAGKGGGLAAMGAAGAGSDTLFGSRQAATLLTKATWWCGGIFLVLAFTLSMMAGTTTRPDSILRGVGQQAPATTSPALPTTQPAPAVDPQAVPGEQAAPQTQPAPLGQ
jgi:preprotein translocase subunit SecG